MAKRIEFVGVSGIGKTTTIKALEARWKPVDNWWLFGALLKENFPKSKKVKILAANYFKRIVGTASSNDFQNQRYNNLNAFVKKHPGLIEAFWKTLQNHNDYYGDDLRFQEVEYVKYLMEKVQIIHDDPSHKACLIDEGIVHNLNYFVSDPLNLHEVCHLLKLMELPQAIIYFEADIEIVMERVLKRNTRILRDQKLSKENMLHSRKVSLIEKENFIKAAKSIDIPVLSLKAEENAGEKAEKIISFITVLDNNETKIL